jgi:hypothetical protein
MNYSVWEKDGPSRIYSRATVKEAIEIYAFYRNTREPIAEAILVFTQGEDKITRVYAVKKNNGSGFIIKPAKVNHIDQTR